MFGLFVRVFAVIFVSLVLFAPPAMADSSHDNTGSATATATAYGGDGGNANATIQKGAIENHNSNLNLNSNENRNTNLNTNRQAQGQLQGQLQGQMQGQAISDSANNSAFNQQNILVEKPDRGLIAVSGYQTPGQLEYRGPYGRGIYHDATPWTRKSTWTAADVKKLPSCFFGSCGDITVVKFRELSASEKFEVAKATNFQPVGMIIDQGGNGDTPAHIWGDVANEILGMGGTVITVDKYSVTFANKSTGWNVGIGGGVSATNNGEANYGGSVGGGTGIGSVTTAPVERCGIVVMVFAK